MGFSPSERPALRTALLLSAAFAALVAKTWLISFRTPAAWAGSLVETAALCAIWGLSEALAGRKGAGLRSVLAATLFYPLFSFVFMLHFAHTFFFEEATQRKFSLVEVGLSAIAYFFRHVLPARGYVALALALLLASTLAVVLRRKTSARTLTRAALVLSALSFGGSGLCLLLTPVATPLVDVAIDLREVARHTQITLREDTKKAGPLAMLDKSKPLARPFETRYDKVIVIVMETMWNEKFEQERAALPASTFVRATEAHSHKYTNYYTTNQDSRTSVLALISSRFIPYEAYTEEGRDHYMPVSRKSSLVDVFRTLGHETAFAASQSELELVVEDFPWDEKLMLSAEEIEKTSSTLLCFNPYEFEHSCEDKALLPKVFAFLDGAKRALLVQQMMWGHASEYNEASGKTNTQYYSEYLDALVAHQRERGELERTLFVLTADHGFRELDQQTRRAVYEVPLWFYAPGLESERSAQLYSHLDLKDLLLHELGAAQPLPPENPFLLVVGPTGTSMVSVLSGERGLLVMRDRGFARYVLYDEGRGKGALDGGPYLKLLHEYRAEFERTVTPAPAKGRRRLD